MTVAVDTDNELLSLKFSNSTASATSYLASLFAGMSVIYERDLFVRLLQGYTVLRLSSAADPWTQPACPAWPATCQNTGGASTAQLMEVAGYWAANYGPVPRALAMTLSGKQPSGNSASGIAYVNTLCSGSSGYSFSQVFKFAGSTAAHDVSLVAHELGHNFGSRHTHCYPTPTTPIDECYNGEGGCYGGTTSCPAPFTITPINGGPVTDVRGTLMSYCHLLSGCSASPVFHPQTVDVIAPIVDGKVNVCVFPGTGAATPTISAVVPSSGPVGGGTTVTLTGTGFESGATVAFLDATRAVAAASVTFVSGTRLTVVTPAHAAGVADVVVGNPTKRTATKAGGFTFTATPPAGTSFYTVSPCRLVDTRGASGPAIAAGAARTFTLAGSCGLPSGAKAVSLNVTVVAGTSAGNVVVYPGDLSAPSTSTLNFGAGQTRANFAILGLATNGTGTVAVRNRAATAVHVVLDTGGYFQ